MQPPILKSLIILLVFIFLVPIAILTLLFEWLLGEKTLKECMVSHIDFLKELYGLLVQDIE